MAQQAASIEPVVQPAKPPAPTTAVAEKKKVVTTSKDLLVSESTTQTIINGIQYTCDVNGNIVQKVILEKEEPEVIQDQTADLTTSHFSYKSYEHQPIVAKPVTKAQEEDKTKLYRKDIDDIIKYIESDEKNG